MGSMPTWPITCGTCGRDVSADVVSGWDLHLSPPQQLAAARKATLWLRCPNEACGEGSVKLKSGAVYPAAPFGRMIQGLPSDVDEAWREARVAHNVAAYTAAEMMCRKILMNVAVNGAGASTGRRFVVYVNALQKGGYITTGLISVVDKVRDRGNIANHELPPSTEQDSRLTLTITEHLLAAIYELPSLVPTPPAPAPEASSAP